jgi:hypothetical protein
MRSLKSSLYIGAALLNIAVGFALVFDSRFLGAVVCFFVAGTLITARMDG